MKDAARLKCDWTGKPLMFRAEYSDVRVDSQNKVKTITDVETGRRLMI